MIRRRYTTIVPRSSIPHTTATASPPVRLVALVPVTLSLPSPPSFTWAWTGDEVTTWTGEDDDAAVVSLLASVVLGREDGEVVEELSIVLEGEEVIFISCCVDVVKTPIAVEGDEVIFTSGVGVVEADTVGDSVVVSFIAGS